MLWENRLSFHNSLIISGGKKVENYWENLQVFDSKIILAGRYLALCWAVPVRYMCYTHESHWD